MLLLTYINYSSFLPVSSQRVEMKYFAVLVYLGPICFRNAKKESPYTTVSQMFWRGYRRSYFPNENERVSDVRKTIKVFHLQVCVVEDNKSGTVSIGLAVGSNNLP